MATIPSGEQVVFISPEVDMSERKSSVNNSVQTVYTMQDIVDTVGTDTNTTYDLSSVQDGANVDIKLTGSDATVDTIQLTAGTNITLTNTGSNVTIDSNVVIPVGVWEAGTGTGAIQAVDGGSTATANYSFAFGKSNTASGLYSSASGAYSTASNLYDTASGAYAIAQGAYSTASGYRVTASGQYSFAKGRNTTASGNYASLAIGDNTTASGPYSVALGAYSVSSAYYSFASQSARATATYATAFSEGFASGEFSFAHGQSTASAYKAVAFSGGQALAGFSFATQTVASNGNSSIAIGYASRAGVTDGGSPYGDGQIAIGTNTYASGQFAMALGSSAFSPATASGYTGIAIGSGSTASASYSLAMNFATASGDSSIAMNGATASGYYAVAISSGISPCEASGEQSVAIGVSCSATAPYSVVIGDGVAAHQSAICLKANSNRDNATFVRELSIMSIPTSAAGLPTGAVWSNAGVLNIVP